MNPCTAYTDLQRALPATGADNSVEDYLTRGNGRIIDEVVTISAAAGSHTINVFQLTGSVWVMDQWAEITEVTTLTNLTNMYATLYDGTNTVTVTADDATISNFPVESIFGKTEDETQPYTAVDSSQCRLTVPGASKKLAYPFIITQKNGANTYLQLHITTTDDPVSSKLRLLFTWRPINGGTFELLI